MDKRIQDLIRDLGADTPAARKAKKQQETAPYIREGSLAGELDADIVNNGFTVVLPPLASANVGVKAEYSMFFIIYTVDGPSIEVTDLIDYFPSYEIVHYVEKNAMDHSFLPDTEVVVFAYLLMDDPVQTGRTTYKVV